MSGLHLRTHPEPQPGCFGCHCLTLHMGGPSFQPHYNWSVGKYVASDREFRDELKRCADDNSERTGTAHSYEYRHPEDLKPFSQADQVLDDRARNISALRAGKPIPVGHSSGDTA